MQLATMASTCFAVVVLFFIKQVFCVPGDTVMFMPPLEVRTLDMSNNRMPFISPSLFPMGQQQIMQMQQQSAMQQPAMSQSAMIQPPIPQPPMQPSTMQQPPMQQPPMQQPPMQQPPMQQPPMQHPPMQQLPMEQPSMQSPVLHHTMIQSSTSAQPLTVKPHDRHNMTFNEFMDVINEMSDRNKDVDEEENFESRAANRDYGYSAPPPPAPYPSSSYSQQSYPSPSYSQQPYSPQSYPPYSSYPRPYGPPRPSYGSYGPPPPAYHHEPSYAPPAIHHTSKTVKSDLVSTLLKPVTTKVAGKVSGLIGLVLSLLGGSAPGDMEMTGFKDIIINGIIKPLLVAKGGIKSLISKLAIPVISLLLINLEVLITIWWLWEECPQPTYSYNKPAYHYNNSY